MKRRVTLAILVLLLGIVAAACGGGEEPVQPPPSQGSEQPLVPESRPDNKLNIPGVITKEEMVTRASTESGIEATTGTITLTIPKATTGISGTVPGYVVRSDIAHQIEAEGPPAIILGLETEIGMIMEQDFISQRERIEMLAQEYNIGAPPAVSFGAAAVDNQEFDIMAVNMNPETAETIIIRWWAIRAREVGERAEERRTRTGTTTGTITLTIPKATTGISGTVPGYVVRSDIAHQIEAEVPPAIVLGLETEIGIIMEQDFISQRQFIEMLAQEYNISAPPVVSFKAVAVDNQEFDIMAVNMNPEMAETIIIRWWAIPATQGESGTLTLAVLPFVKPRINIRCLIKDEAISNCYLVDKIAHYNI